jgi:hypothetical protein
VHEGALAAGFHSVTWDARAQGEPVPAGIYFYRLDTAEGTRSRKLLVVQ